ncbi:MAG: PcfB family protein [Clostridiales bacterium]|nr:PcfB family protein [Clostridiales bacterium]
MQDQLNERSVALYIKAGKLTGLVLAQAMRAFLKRARASPKAAHGHQSVKSLTKQGASLMSAEVSGDNIGDFKKTARKYNVDFAVKRDDSESPPKWIVFFKSKDGAAMDAAFKEYSRQKIRAKEKTALLTKLAKFKEISKQIAAPVKNRHRGERDI